MRYIAFISYRHVDPDRKWAKWLHTKLETYRIPKGMLKQPGASSRLGRCFRDEEELAASADLSAAIKDALQDSEYLIVVCSPAAPVSRWVNEEIKSFAALGRKDKILALLINGEPDQAFPPALLELGDEPLAADVRENNRHAVKDAELRIIATLLGCRFDDLRHREQARKVRRALLFAAVMSLAAIFFAVVSVVAIIQRNAAKSRELAVNSSYVLNNDPELAVLLATQAMQVSSTREAEEALRQGLLRFSLRAVLKGHVGGVERVAFSADGKLLVTAGDDGTVRLWNPATYALIRVIEAHKSPVTSAVFSPDGRLLLTASGSIVSKSGDNVARIWDANSGALLKELHGHEGYITRGVFSQDGKQVLTAGSDGTARFWDAASGDQRAVLPASAQELTSAAFAADNRYAFTTSLDGSVKKWDLGAAKLLNTTPDSGEADGIAVSPNGALVAIFRRGFAHVQNASNLSKFCIIATDDADHFASDVAFSLDGTLVAMAGDDGGGVVASLPPAPTRDGTCPTIVELSGSDGAMNRIVFTPDGQRAITASADHLAKIWDPKTGAVLTPLIGHTGPVTDLAVTHNGQFVATASADGTARLWQIDLTLPSFTLPGENFVASPTGAMQLAWTDSSAVLWDVTKHQQLAKLSGPFGKIAAAAFSDDATQLLTVAADGSAHLWNPASGQLLHSFQKDSVPLTHAAFSRSGDRAAIVSSNGLVRIWDTRAGSLVAELRGHTGAVNSVMFSPDGGRVVTAGDDKTARVWDAANGASLLVFSGHTGPVRRATFTSDGSRVVSVSPGNGDPTSYVWNHEPVRIWDARTGKEYLDLAGHSDIINDAILSPNGKLVLTTSDDNTARIWDVKTGVNRAVFQGHIADVQQAAFSPDSGFAATTGGDCSLRIWDVGSGQNLLVFPESQGCFSAPRFAPDGSVIATNGDPVKGYPRANGVDVFPCEVCVNSKRLLELARQRVTRGLDPAEKARYLQ